MIYCPNAEISSRNRGILASRSPLNCVSKQIHNEYQAVLFNHAPHITAVVKDFDFQHIVTFLNGLSDSELKHLPSVSSTNHQRRITIELRLSSKFNGDTELLRRWLRRCDDHSKKGSGVDFSYVYKSELLPVDAIERVASLTGRPGPWLWLGPSDGWASTWRSGYLERLFGESKGLKQREVAKMILALRGPQQDGSSKAI